MTLSRSVRLLLRMTNSATRSESEVLFSFGAIADVQCGELEDRLSIEPKRYYRQALHCLRDAVESWNQMTRTPSFILQLGDVMDGYNILRGGKEQATRVLNGVLEACRSFDGEFHHAWGNHELYNFTRLELLNSALFSGRRYLKDVHPEAYRRAKAKSKSSPSQTYNGKLAAIDDQITIEPDMCSLESLIKWDSFVFADDKVPVYYDFSPRQGFRFILLDTFDVSTLGYEEESQEVANALGIIRAHNGNDDIRDHIRLFGVEKRFVSFNGGVGSRQLHWLKGVLTKAKALQEKVIVFGHVPYYPEASLEFCLVWNYQEVLEVLQSSGCVVATLSGHTHQFCHREDAAGIHHLVLPGIVECKPGTNGFVTFDLRAESMTMHVAGTTPSVQFEFRTS